MAIFNDTDAKPTGAPNVSDEIASQHALIRELQNENERLRKALERSEAERDGYRHVFLQQARTAREFENLDIATLNSMSAGPVEMLK